jgi:ionotropic glutamate receptor
MKSKEWEKWMVTSNDQAIHLAKTENYAFIMESSSIEYIQYRECDLEQAGPLIDQKSYAIAYAKSEMLKLQIIRILTAV